MPAPDYSREIADLRVGLASSQLTIEVNGERVTYHSFREIRDRIAYFEGLAASATQSDRPRYGASVAAYSRD